MLLVSGGNNNELKCISALCFVDSVYKSSLTGIKLNNLKLLREISAILNSSLFSYFNIQNFSSTGIEREETHDDEKLTIPYSSNEGLHSLVTDIEKLVAEKHASNKIFLDPTIDIAVENKFNQIDFSIYESLSCSPQEKDLLEYTNKVVIPIAMRHNGYESFFKPLLIGNTIFEEYAFIYLNRFKSKLNTNASRFIVEIWHTNQVIGMFFKMMPVNDYTQEIIWVNKQNNDWEILSLLTSISSEKVTEKLFVQKDVRGFEKDYFYIFKPNEKRLWHKAIGYLDVNDFADAILKEGRNKK